MEQTIPTIMPTGQISYDIVKPCQLYKFASEFKDLKTKAEILSIPCRNINTIRKSLKIIFKRDLIGREKVNEFLYSVENRI